MKIHTEILVVGWEMGFEPTIFGTTIRVDYDFRYIRMIMSALIFPYILRNIPTL